MHIKIFGQGCVKCELLKKNVEEAVNQLSLKDVEVEKISEIEKMVEEGVISVPTLMIDGSVKVSGEVPTVENIKKWLNE